MDDGKKEKKRKDISGKVGKEMNDRRDDGRHYNETVSALHNTALQLSTRPETVPLYNLRLLPLTIERSSLLAQLEAEEKHALECAQIAYEEERLRVEDEWQRGRDRVRERLLEGIEERRRRAREEKDGEGTIGDAALDAQSRPHITRKLRNKMGTSPPPTPLGLPGSSSSALMNGNGNGLLLNGLPLTNGSGGPFLNPHSLSVDDIPSPFPLALTSTVLPHVTANTNGASANGGGGRRRPKASGTHQSQAIGGLGKSLAMLAGARETEIESDLVEITRGNKRRRATAASLGKTTIV